MKNLLPALLLLSLVACSSGQGGAGGSSGGGRSTSDERVRTFLGGPLPAAPAGGQWVRHMSTLSGGDTPKVIYYQFAFPT